MMSSTEQGWGWPGGSCNWLTWSGRCNSLVSMKEWHGERIWMNHGSSRSLRLQSWYLMITHTHTHSLRTRLNSSAAWCSLLGLGVLRLVSSFHIQSRSCSEIAENLQPCRALSWQWMKTARPHNSHLCASTISFFLALLGWFALAPLSLEVATSIGRCENHCSWI